MKQGIIMEIQTKDAYVFTNECDLIKVPARKEMFVGQSVALPEVVARPVSHRRWMVPALAAACVVLLLCTGLLLANIFAPQAGKVYLSLDINPSVEFELDADRIVTQVTPLNSDAWELLNNSDIEWIGQEYHAAIVAWVNLVREKMPEEYEDLLISAILDKRDREFADEIMGLKNGQAGDLLAALEGLDVKVLYTTDPQVKEAADANNLSIGRQMLLNEALKKDPKADIEIIRTAPLGTLLNWLLSEDTVLTSPPTETTKPTETTVETSETTVETIPETTEGTTAETTAPSAGLTLAATNNGSGWGLNWTISPSGKILQYYKVVVSTSDSSPTYPENGYIAAISERAATTMTVNNSKSYNGAYMTVGQKYYVGVTYVFKDGSKQYSNVLALKYNGPAYVAPAYERVLSGYSDASGFHLSWTQGPGDGFEGYKVVVSKTNSAPLYPGDGYLDYISNRADTSFVADNSYEYPNPAYLETDTYYYVAITYLVGGEKVPSNVLHLKYTGPAHTPAPTESFDTVLSGNGTTTGVQLTWTLGPNDGRFDGYKVVRSTTNENPAYPVDGHITYITNLDTTFYFDDGIGLDIGTEYFYAITYVIAGELITSNPLPVTYWGNTE